MNGSCLGPSRLKKRLVICPCGGWPAAIACRAALECCCCCCLAPAAGLSDADAAELLTNIRLGAPSEDSVLVQLLSHWADRGRARPPLLQPHHSTPVQGSSPTFAGQGQQGQQGGAGVASGMAADAPGPCCPPVACTAAGAGKGAASGLGLGLQPAVAPSFRESTTELRMLRQQSGTQVCGV